MRKFIALAGASLAAIASTAAAQTPSTPMPAAAAEQATLGEIVVTARRKSESLQEVPQTVNAVTADTLQKLNITQFQDVQNVVPGLSLQNGSTGYQATAQLRGVTFDVNTGAPLPTVAFYANDAPVQAGFLFNSLFDVSQIEVLRGPQGTTRGVSAPSGAITITLHKPDLSDFGGAASVTLTDQHGRNFQGALNIPIIKDVLAIRVAGLLDENDFNGVRSINNSLRPIQRTSAERISVSFEPSDRFNANVTYQHLDSSLMAFDQVSGPGPTGTAFAAINPPISPFERAAVEDGISRVHSHQDLVTAQIDSRIFGQHLSYVGSYQHSAIHARNLGLGDSDMGNQLPGVELYNYQDIGTPKATTQEVRLASDPTPGRFIDYTVGAYYSWTFNDGTVVNPDTLLPGVFGSPATMNPLHLTTYNAAYVLPLSILIPSTSQETSLFGSVTLHLGANTELSGGIRHIWSIVDNHTTIEIGNSQTAVPASAVGGACAAQHLTSTYAGFCDVPVNVGLTIPVGTRTPLETPNIYNLSLSHHFTPDIMAYVNSGTSFRAPFTSVGISGGVLTSSNPAIANLSNHPPERSRSYEIGVKTTFLGGRARFNADVFRQSFTNFTLYVPNILYVSSQGPTQFNFTAPVDALVQGFEFDTALQITRDWNVALQASYSDGKVQGSSVPCNTYAADGVTPTFNEGFISLCKGGSASRLPYWNATLSSEYDHPIANKVDGFIRGILTYYPQNKNRMEPDFTVDSYSLLNVYAGVHSEDGAWEVSVFAKNAFQTERLLDKAPVQQNISNLLGAFGNAFPSTSGYYPTTVTPQREVGVNVRYAFGSR